MKRRLRKGWPESSKMLFSGDENVILILGHDGRKREHSRNTLGEITKTHRLRSVGWTRAQTVHPRALVFSRQYLEKMTLASGKKKNVSTIGDFVKLFLNVIKTQVIKFYLLLIFMCVWHVELCMHVCIWRAHIGCGTHSHMHVHMRSYKHS